MAEIEVPREKQLEHLQLRGKGKKKKSSSSKKGFCFLNPDV